MTLHYCPSNEPRPSAGETITLAGALQLHDDPAVASDEFSIDELFVVELDPELLDEGALPACTTWRVTGRRTMARHGASALDTEVGVTLLQNPGDPRDPSVILGQAMMRLALAMAS